MSLFKTTEETAFLAHATAIVRIGVFLVAFPLLLAACEEERVEFESRARTIEIITVTDRMSGRLDRYPGIVEAVDTSSISFEVAGNTREVNVNIGDRVEEGEVLATLDETPFQLNVEGAEAALAKARAQLAEKETEYQRQTTLYEKGWVAKSAYDEALAARDSRANEVAYATSQLALAHRDLEKTKLEAPFDGVIANKYVEPFQEVARGERMFEIYREGDLEVFLSVPESTISDFHLGLPAQITFPAEQVAESVAGEVSEIGTLAIDANAYPVKVALADPLEKVMPGMVAEVAVTLGETGGPASYLVPLSAIAAGEKSGEGYVFVFDPESSTVKKTQVSGAGVEGNRVNIAGGIAPGDMIAVAGVTFLRDGQKVNPISEQEIKPEESPRQQKWELGDESENSQIQ